MMIKPEHGSAWLWKHGLLSSQVGSNFTSPSHVERHVPLGKVGKKGVIRT